jgi:hypothetical protein
MRCSVRRTHLPLTLLAVLGACDSPAPLAPPAAPGVAIAESRAATTSTEIVVIPVSGRDTDACTGNGFAFSGTIRQVYHRATNGNQILLLFHENTSNVKGVGDDGTRYVIVEGGQVNGKISVPLGGGKDATVARFRVMSQGSGGNFQLHLIEHVAIRPDGSFTVTLSHFTSSCKG